MWVTDTRSDVILLHVDHAVKDIKPCLTEPKLLIKCIIWLSVGIFTAVNPKASLHAFLKHFKAAERKMEATENQKIASKKQMKYKKTNTHLPSSPDNASKPSLSLEHNAPHINHFREFFFSPQMHPKDLIALRGIMVKMMVMPFTKPRLQGTDLFKQRGGRFSCTASNKMFQCESLMWLRIQLHTNPIKVF